MYLKIKMFKGYLDEGSNNAIERQINSFIASDSVSRVIDIKQSMHQETNSNIVNKRYFALVTVMYEE